MYKRGMIVLVPFPFTDLSGNKVRPAVIISDGKIGNDIILLFITTQLKHKVKHAVKIDPCVENGLKASSKIMCSKIATLEAKVVLGELGKISLAIQQEIDCTLKSVLGLH